jgi:hypothetical protein
MFQKMGSTLMIIGKPPFAYHDGHSHFEVARKGDRYQMLKNTHTIPNYYGPGWDLYDPNLPYFEWEADIIATRKYMGLRHDPALALADPMGAMIDLASLLTPTAEEELAIVVEEFFHEAPSKGLVDAAGEFTQEASRVLMQTIAEVLSPEAALVFEVTDLIVDVGELARDLGFIWAP